MPFAAATILFIASNSNPLSSALKIGGAFPEGCQTGFQSLPPAIDARMLQ